MMLCTVGKLMGAAKVILVNRSAPRLETAKKLNIADHYVCLSEEDIIETVLGLTCGLGADVVFTSCPSPQAQADAVKIAGNRARINFFGGLPKDKAIVPIDTNLIHYKELLVSGAHGSTPVHHRKAIELIASGCVDAKKYITHTFLLEDIISAFTAAEERAGLRVIVNPWEE
jgi:L-iditol 2-dehydrogenase